MKISALVSSQFKSIVKVLQQKEKLEARLLELNSRIATLEKKNLTLNKLVKGKGGRPSSQGTRKRRSNLKEEILALLKSAGVSGIKVSVIATKLKLSTNNIYSWFYTTGTTIRGIKKVGPGKYALKK